ncbi:MAG: sulfur transferase domain-containing protein, partial [Pseudomonadota bacterium]
MHVNKLTEKLSVGPQIAPTDVDTLKRQGFRAIIGNRPDGEGADQPGFAESFSVSLLTCMASSPS